MTFGHQFSLLWLLAWAALGWFILSAFWLVISSVWQLSRKNLSIINTESKPLKPGDFEALIPPREKLTALQVGKMMLLLAAVLLAYEVGIKKEKAETAAKYQNELSSWQQQHAEYERLIAVWSSRQPKEKK